MVYFVPVNLQLSSSIILFQEEESKGQNHGQICWFIPHYPSNALLEYIWSHFEIKDNTSKGSLSTESALKYP